MELLYLGIGLALGLIIGWLIFRNKRVVENSAFNDPRVAELDRENAALKERASTLLELNKKLENSLNEEREKLAVANNRLAKAEEAFRAQEDKFKTLREETENMQKRFTTEFQNVANKILDEKSEKFVKLNKDNLDGILNPLKEKIKDFEEKVEKSYKTEAAERNSLKGEIKSLVELNQQLSKEAAGLARALKGDSKKQGNWGEIILERVLERSGLQKDVEYKTQVSLAGDDGKRLQPDVVVFLPDNKHIIIDAKVSLLAYDKFINAQSEDEKALSLMEHVSSVKNHIKGLSEKNYQAKGDFTSPDFVLLFLPIESSFSLAFQADNELFSYAWDKKIVLVSPTTLLATLRTIASIWKQEKQTRNVLEIAVESGKLYDKFVGFIEDLKNVGAKFMQAQESYEDAMKKLHTGPGNLVKRAETLRTLGAKTTKIIPADITLKSEDDAI